MTTKLASLPLIEIAEVAENTNSNNNFITSHSTQINTSITVSTEHKTESNSQNICQKESLIRIIDNISKNLQRNNSADIKNRITKVSSLGITFDFFYTLPRGGIAIHLQSKEITQKLEVEIENIYPNSTCSVPLTQQNKKELS